MKTHVKWIAVAAVVLMLLAMFAYVASNDEADVPEPPVAEQGTE